MYYSVHIFSYCWPLIHYFSYHWPLIHYQYTSAWLPVVLDFCLGRWVEQKSLCIHPHSNYSTCLNILRENRQTYVSKTANTNRMTKKRTLSATTATWSMLPSVFWSRTSLPAATQKNYLNCTLSSFWYHHKLQTAMIPLVFQVFSM